MLFRYNQSFKQLQTERELLLEDLNQKASLLNLNLSVVFDAAYQAGGRSRSHFNALEIIYTAEGETADEYLVDMVSHLRRPRQIIVVTNDKILASHIRHSSVKIETVNHFMEWLNRSYAKRLKTPKIDKKPLLPISRPLAIVPKMAPLISKEIVSPKTNKESEFEYYQRIFEAEYENLKQLEAVKKRPAKKTRQPKKIKQDPFTTPRLIKNESTEMERWLKAFEEELEEQ